MNIKKIKNLGFFEIFKHSSTYFSGTLMIHFLGLVSFPVFTAFLTPEEYGIINVINSFIDFFKVVLSFYLFGAINRYYFEKGKNDFNAFLSTTILATSLIFIVNAVVLLFFRDYFSAWLNLPEIALWIIVPTAFGMIFFAVFQQLTIAEKKTKLNVTISVALHYIKFLFIIAGLYYFYNYDPLLDDGSPKIYYGKIFGDLAGVGLIMIAILYILRKRFVFKGFKKEYIKYSLVYCVPLIPFALSNYILNYFDQWFINAAVGQMEAGKYAFAYKIGALYVGLSVALLNASNPEFFELMNKKDTIAVEEQNNSISKMLILGAGFLILFSIDIGTILSSNEAFLAALNIAPFIVLGYVFNALAGINNRSIYFEKKNIYLTIIVLSGGFLNIVLNAYYIPIYGYQVAAYTTLVSYIIILITSIVITDYILKVKTLKKRVIFKQMAFLMLVLIVFYFYCDPSEGLVIRDMIIKVLLFLGLSTALFFNKIPLLFSKE